MVLFVWFSTCHLYLCIKRSAVPDLKYVFNLCVSPRQVRCLSPARQNRLRPRPPTGLLRRRWWPRLPRDPVPMRTSLLPSTGTVYLIWTLVVSSFSLVRWFFLLPSRSSFLPLQFLLSCLLSVSVSISLAVCLYLTLTLPSPPINHCVTLNSISVLLLPPSSSSNYLLYFHSNVSSQRGSIC